MTFHVGWNIPGYLPEDRPICFKEESAALECLRAEARSVGEDFYMYHDEVCVWSQGDYGKSCDCYSYRESLNASGLASAITDGDFRAGNIYQIGKYVYWVVEVNGCECEDTYLAPTW